MAENKNNKDAFASVSFGGADKYLKRHQETLKQEKAVAFDKKVEDFYAKSHTLDWAHIALEFCERESDANKDIAEISRGYQKLEQIKEEAKEIIRAEELRKKKEIEEQKLKAIELERKKMAEEKKFVENLKKEIKDLSTAKRNEDWVKAVDGLNLTMSELSDSLKNQVTNRFLIDGFNKELPNIKSAVEFDEKISALASKSQKNKAWAEQVFALEKQVLGRYEKYMSNKTKLAEMSKNATRIIYNADLNKVESFVNRVENYWSDSLASELAQMQKVVDRLGNILYISEYITNFDSRWNRVCEKIEDEVKSKNARERKRKAEEDARRKAEAKQRAEEERQERERQRRYQEEQEKQERRKKKIARTVTISIEVLIWGGILLFGILMLPNTIGLWVFAVAIPLLYKYLRQRIDVVLFESRKTTRSYFAIVKYIDTIFAIAVVALNVASIWVKSFKLYFLPALIIWFAFVIIGRIRILRVNKK